MHAAIAAIDTSKPVNSFFFFTFPSFSMHYDRISQHNNAGLECLVWAVFNTICHYRTRESSCGVPRRINREDNKKIIETLFFMFLLSCDSFIRRLWRDCPTVESCWIRRSGSAGVPPATFFESINCYAFINAAETAALPGLNRWIASSGPSQSRRGICLGFFSPGSWLLFNKQRFGRRNQFAEPLPADSTDGYCLKALT